MNDNIREIPPKRIDDDHTVGTGIMTHNASHSPMKPNDNDGVDRNSNDSRQMDSAEHHYLEPQTKNEIPPALNVLHLVGALIQTAEAIFLFAYSNNVNLKWLLYTNYPVAVDSALAQTIGGIGTDNVYFARPDSQYLTSFSVPWVTGAIVGLSAVDHIAAIVPFGGRQWYEYDLMRNRASFRWLEYSISCSLMNMHIAQLVGVTDIHMIVLIFVLSISIQYPAYIHEVVNAKARADGYTMYWSPLVFGAIPWLAVWGVIFSYYSESIAAGEDPPSFVLPTVVATFILESTFPTVFVLQWKKVGIFEDYIMGEYAFMILGLVAKSSLAWITLIGAEKYAQSFQFDNAPMDEFFD